MVVAKSLVRIAMQRTLSTSADWRSLDVNSTPLQVYRNGISKGALRHDPRQENIMIALESLFQRVHSDPVKQASAEPNVESRSSWSSFSIGTAAKQTCHIRVLCL
jgi:hypothetical protein